MGRKLLATRREGFSVGCCLQDGQFTDVDMCSSSNEQWCGIVNYTVIFTSCGGSRTFSATLSHTSRHNNEAGQENQRSSICTLQEHCT